MICTKCFKDAPDVSVKSSFLGFPRFTCPHCKGVVHYPLKMRTKVVYYILVGLMLVGAAVALSNHAIPIPGFIGVAVIIALVDDMSIAGKVREARRRHDALKAASSPPAAAAGQGG